MQISGAEAPDALGERDFRESDLYEKWESTQFTLSCAAGSELLRLVLAERHEGGAVDLGGA
jgi:hypothetical protein